MKKVTIAILSVLCAFAITNNTHAYWYNMTKFVNNSDTLEFAVIKANLTNGWVGLKNDTDYTWKAYAPKDSVFLR